MEPYLSHHPTTVASLDPMLHHQQQQQLLAEPRQTQTSLHIHFCTDTQQMSHASGPWLLQLAQPMDAHVNSYTCLHNLFFHHARKPHGPVRFFH